MKSIFFILIIVSLAYHGRGQEADHIQLPKATDNYRYQIVEADFIGMKVPLKIDKFNGRVFRFVKANDGFIWDLMLVEKDYQQLVIPDMVNYHIFTSDFSDVPITFLLNVNTGATWRLANDQDIGLFWSYME